MAHEPGNLDYQFSLANERTVLAWVRTGLALIALGIAAAKALSFEHEVWRWLVAAPPILAGAWLVADATTARWRGYESAMRQGKPLPVGPRLGLLGMGLSIYGLVALFATIVD
jgi:putative membrane protein